MRTDGLLATLDGRLEDAVTVGQDILTRGEQLGLAQWANLMGCLTSLTSLLHLGRLDQIPQLFKNSLLLSNPLIRLDINPAVDAVKILDQWVVARPGIGTADDETPAYFDVLLLQAAVRTGHCSAAELLLRRFAGSRMSTTGSSFKACCIPRHLGAAAALLGEPEDARRYYDEALKVTTEMRFRPELALTRLQLAELLLEHYPEEKTAALDHLDFAIKEFREMKMQPSLERALKHRQLPSESASESVSESKGNE